MQKRGTILRGTEHGPGLIMVEGAQLSFQLEGVWRSASAPAPNMLVDVELDPSGKITGVTAVDAAQIAREQADVAMRVAREKGGAALEVGGQLLGQLGARLGYSVLIATALLAIAWLFLSCIDVKVTASFVQSFTFWKLMSIANSGNVVNALQAGEGSGTGLYGLLAFAALTGPFWSLVVKRPAAQLGNCAPLAWMLCFAFLIWLNINYAMSDASATASQYGGAQAQRFAEQMAAEMAKQVRAALSFGIGAYLSAACSVFLCSVGIKKYFAAKAAALNSL